MNVQGKCVARSTKGDEDLAMERPVLRRVNDQHLSCLFHMLFIIRLANEARSWLIMVLLHDNVELLGQWGRLIREDRIQKEVWNIHDRLDPALNCSRVL